MAVKFCLAMTFLAFASAFSAQAAPSKLECSMRLAAAGNVLATLGRLQKSLDGLKALAAPLGRSRCLCRPVQQRCLA